MVMTSCGSLVISPLEEAAAIATEAMKKPPTEYLCMDAIYMCMLIPICSKAAEPIGTLTNYTTSRKNEERNWLNGEGIQ